MLHETEKVHARMRRYSSPDEHPFYDGLPEPVLERLSCVENPLAPNSVNVNARIYRHYVAELVPRICRQGDDRQYGSTALCDVACLQALSKRIHYGKFVAESKFQADPDLYSGLIDAADAEAILSQVTNPEVEACLLDRVQKKATSSSGMLLEQELRHAFPVVATSIYRDFIVPLTKEVEVQYLLQRGKQ
jgi:chorismate mutase